ncbi:MAG: ribonuclease HI [Christensenellales bacterium]|jgi:ribonuclease HI
MKEVRIYTDGACSGNPGVGGWGAVLLYGTHRKEISGADPHTTNNRMEITAALEALTSLKEPCRVQLYSDSAYLVNAFNQQWIQRWRKNGWRTSKKKPVENQDLWLALFEQSEKHSIIWNKVKGHADNIENNRCDTLATTALKELSTENPLKREEI